MLDKPVPWGRDGAEYAAMFALGELPADVRVLDVGGGPASFVAERTAAGGAALALDPLYAWTADAIRARVAEARPEVMGYVRANAERYLWDTLGSPDALERRRMSAMERFLADYDAGRAAGRYRAGALPDLDLPDDAADLALVSHLLFTYAAALDRAFHLAALRELLRVAPEVRVFPLVELDGTPARHLDGVLDTLRAECAMAQIESVPYAFQRGADLMLRLRRA